MKATFTLCNLLLSEICLLHVGLAPLAYASTPIPQNSHSNMGQSTTMSSMSFEEENGWIVVKKPSGFI